MVRSLFEKLAFSNFKSKSKTFAYLCLLHGLHPLPIPNMYVNFRLIFQYHKCMTLLTYSLTENFRQEFSQKISFTKYKISNENYLRFKQLFLNPKTPEANNSSVPK